MCPEASLLLSLRYLCSRVRAVHAAAANCAHCMNRSRNAHLQLMSREEALKKLEDYSHLLGEDGLSPEDIEKLRSVDPGDLKTEL